MNNCDLNVIAIWVKNADVETYLLTRNFFHFLSTLFSLMSSIDVVLKRVLFADDAMLHNLHSALFFSLERLYKYKISRGAAAHELLALCLLNVRREFNNLC